MQHRNKDRSTFQNRNRIRAIGGFSLATAVSIAGIALLGTSSGNTPTSRSYPSAHELAILKDRTYETEREIAQFVDDARLVLTGFEESERVLTFFKVHAIPAIVEGQPGNEQLRAFPRERTPAHFFVVVLDAERASEALGGNAVAGFHVESRTMILGRMPASPPIRGSSVSHEMFHAYEGMTGQWFPTAPWSDETVAGEVRAYEFEFRVIDHWTRGGFFREIDKLKTRLEPLGYPRISDEDCHDLDALFPPPAGEAERRLRKLLYRLASMFRGVDASNTRDPFRQKMQAYRYIAGLPDEIH